MTDNFYTDRSRRKFIKISAIGFITAPLVTHLLIGADAQAQARSARNAPPQGIPALNEDDEQAKALHYTQDATKASPMGRQSHQFCSNCQLFSGQPGAEWGPCAIFSYRKNPKTNAPFVVSAQGWCQGWGPRASAR